MKYKDRVTLKLTEGITLLFSISFLYWVYDYGFLNLKGWYIALIIISLLLSMFSIINALTFIRLSKINRLILSIWTTIILFTLAIDNIISTFNNPDMESSLYFSDKLYIGIQYFLLGVSAVYIARNYELLIRFLPNKSENYAEQLKENKQDHIERFSDKQVDILHAVLCIAYTASIFLLNHSFQILPRNTAIWFVIFTFPLIIHAFSILRSKSKLI